MTEPSDQVFLNAKQLRERYRIAHSTLWEWERTGKIPMGFKMGNVRRWKLAELEEWEEQCRRH